MALGLRGEVARVHEMTAGERERVRIVGLIGTRAHTGERGPQIVDDRVELRFPLAFAADSTFQLLRDRRGPGEVPGLCLGQLTAFTETFQCVHAHGLEEAPPISDRGALANDEALVDESTDDVTYIRSRRVPPATAVAAARSKRPTKTASRRNRVRSSSSSRS